MQAYAARRSGRDRVDAAFPARLRGAVRRSTTRRRRLRSTGTGSVRSPPGRVAPPAGHRARADRPPPSTGDRLSSAGVRPTAPARCRWSRRRGVPGRFDPVRVVGGRRRGSPLLPRTGRPYLVHERIEGSTAMPSARDRHLLRMTPNGSTERHEARRGAPNGPLDRQSGWLAGERPTLAGPWRCRSTCAWQTCNAWGCGHIVTLDGSWQPPRTPRLAAVEWSDEQDSSSVVPAYRRKRRSRPTEPVGAWFDRVAEPEPAEVELRGLRPTASRPPRELSPAARSIGFRPIVCRSTVGFEHQHRRSVGAQAADSPL